MEYFLIWAAKHGSNEYTRKKYQGTKRGARIMAGKLAKSMGPEYIGHVVSEEPLW